MQDLEVCEIFKKLQPLEKRSIARPRDVYIYNSTTSEVSTLTLEWRRVLGTSRLNLEVLRILWARPRSLGDLALDLGHKVILLKLKPQELHKIARKRLGRGVSLTHVQ